MGEVFINGRAAIHQGPGCTALRFLDDNCLDHDDYARARPW
jgi:hypothetical protein